MNKPLPSNDNKTRNQQNSLDKDNRGSTQTVEVENSNRAQNPSQKVSTLIGNSKQEVRNKVRPKTGNK